MNAERILNIVMMEMATDKLKLEAELESYINSKDMNLNDKTNMIKSTLLPKPNLQKVTYKGFRCWRKMES